MAEMKTERKSVLEYLSKNKFLIPMYQRPYTWDKEECEQLWNDIVEFTENTENTEDDEYFLGTIVMYDDNGQKNIIDGQQRTTTLSLLIRALYQKAHQQKKDIGRISDDLESCLWIQDKKTRKVDYNMLRLESKVAIDSDNELLRLILSDKYDIPKNENDIRIKIKKSRSNYEKNFLYFILKSDEYAKNQPQIWEDFCLKILNECIVLPIECDSRDNALRIFNTLNNRGIPLSDSDIIKGEIFSHTAEKEQEYFANEWKKLESKVKSSEHLKSLDFLFTQYMHILRAKNGDYDTTTPSTLDFLMGKIKKEFYKDKNIHQILISKETFIFIKQLADFWLNPYTHLSEISQKYFDVLNKYQNDYWKIPVSMCIWEFRDKNKEELKIDENIFDKLFPRLITFISVSLVNGRGTTSSLKTTLYKTNVEIHKDKNIVFQHNLKWLSYEEFLKFCSITQTKNIKYLLLLYAYLFDIKQQREWDWKNDKSKQYHFCALNAEVEHILPKAWQNACSDDWNETEHKEYLEQIGNKMLLEKQLNIKSADNLLAKKQETYRSSGFKEAQKMGNIINKNKWLKKDIEARNKEIYTRLKNFFEENL
ncbi:DUF262 domain-containing protein [Helicobacter sp. MIT 11-5569]|uniref:DUF262 domain-containing protein n=1 Tax=Helicobacter sp. MIT 11-5569 TaxID=1548151 RepID=UPI00051FD2A1|nr:DUF262 domain-containing protein [Helicobacter sp. MIT 11-5569]TLD83257.1 DUF262 domain-containing protein [Helicobacter sp. MIT 11-5569]